MPAKSKAQANLMRAAEHGAGFTMARKVRASMTDTQLREFAETPSKKLPRKIEHEAYAYDWRSRNNLKRG